MSINEEVISPLKKLLLEFTTAEKNEMDLNQAHLEKIQSKYYECYVLYLISILCIMPFLSNFLALLLGMSSLIILGMDSTLPKIIALKTNKKIKVADDKMLISYLQMNEKQIMYIINKYINEDIKNIQVIELKEQFQCFRMNYINKDWKAIIMILPSLLENIEIKLNENEKMKAYDKTLGIKEMEYEKEAGLNYKF